MVKHCVSSTRHHEETDKDQRDDGIIIDSLDLSSLPLPWYRSHSLWTNLMARTFDETYKCHANFLEAHPAISTRMRSVLCDWLIEVKQNPTKAPVESPLLLRCAKCIIFIEKAIIWPSPTSISICAIPISCRRRNCNSWASLLSSSLRRSK